MSYQKRNNQIVGILLLASFSYVLIRACIEFYNIAWGSGVWLGEFSFKWGVSFLAFLLFCIFSWIGAVLIVWRQNSLARLRERIVLIRGKLEPLRWLLILGLLVFPSWFLQYTPWGIVFSGIYFRLLLWTYIVFGIAVFMQTGKCLTSWSVFLVTLLLASSVFSITVAMANVTDYPFSLTWSEGNRLWDYSVLFGSDLYDYPVDKKIFSLTDVGRQFVGGLPFLFNDVTIYTERFWVGLTTVIPYLLLGLAAFKSEFKKSKKIWLLLALYTFIILNQGPIHPPLVLCAALVAFLWKRPLWFAIPLIFVTGYLAEVSRFTWMFAPGIWIVMLEFSGALLKDGRLQKSIWWRAGMLGISGELGGCFGYKLVDFLKTFFENGNTVAGGGAINLSFISEMLYMHPLLWYRLFPNATSGIGVLLILLIAIGPTITLLIYLSITKKWRLNGWQKLALVLPLLAFLVVGVIVSTKAGGGGDLHNFDMFLIGLLFTAVLAWENGGRQWLSQIDAFPVWIKGVWILLLVIPGIHPLSALRSSHFIEDSPWLMVLADVSDKRDLEMLPGEEEVDEVMDIIRKDVDAAKSQGEILFIDQRQLLTFGYVNDVELVPEYEKKVLMNMAIADNAEYFAEFYTELASRRFSLIINEPLRAPLKDSNFEFGEENNAWVKWVVYPVLCYYEPVETFKNVQIELLVPRQGDFDCSTELPAELQD